MKRGEGQAATGLHGTQPRRRRQLSKRAASSEPTFLTCNTKARYNQSRKPFGEVIAQTLTLTRSSPPSAFLVQAHYIADIEVHLASRPAGPGKEFRPRMPPAVLEHRAKIYANVCNEREPEYSDYERLSVSWGDQDNYEVRAVLKESTFYGMVLAPDVVLMDSLEGCLGLAPERRKQARAVCPVCLSQAARLPRVGFAAGLGQGCGQRWGRGWDKRQRLGRGWDRGWGQESWLHGSPPDFSWHLTTSASHDIQHALALTLLISPRSIVPYLHTVILAPLAGGAEGWAREV